MRRDRVPTSEIRTGSGTGLSVPRRSPPHHALHMIIEKRTLTLGRWFSRSHHVLGNGWLGDLDAEFQQLTVNARCAPAWVVATHHSNQIANLFCYPGPPLLAMMNLPRPEQTKALRCQATTVSGLTMIKKDTQSAQIRLSQSQKIGSAVVSFNRFGFERRSTMSCCRSTGFSTRNCADVAATSRGIDGRRSSPIIAGPSEYFGGTTLERQARKGLSVVIISGASKSLSFHGKILRLNFAKSSASSVGHSKRLLK